jgi:hypothetical protein
MKWHNGRTRRSRSLGERTIPFVITSDALCLTVLCELCERKTAIFPSVECAAVKYPFIGVFAGPSCLGFWLTPLGARRGPSTKAFALKACGF